MGYYERWTRSSCGMGRSDFVFYSIVAGSTDSEAIVFLVSREGKLNEPSEIGILGSSEDRPRKILAAASRMTISSQSGV